MPEKCQGYSFYRFNEFLRENQQGKEEGVNYAATQIGIKQVFSKIVNKAFRKG